MATVSRKALGAATARQLGRQLRRHGFGTKEYFTCFGNLPPTPAKEPIQAKVVEMMAKQKTWSDPVCTVIKGEKFSEGKTVATLNAFNQENGKMIHGTEALLDKVITHIKGIKPTVKDYRKQIRSIEKRLVTEHAPALIVNQALDFQKQDGFTEIEEWTQACVVEQRFNDCLLRDEEQGKFVIRRDPAFIGCVSNFSNFLDLCRKTLRNLEVGVPCVVMSRSTITQHMYRWFLILQDELKKEGLPADLITYASFDVPSQGKILRSFPDSPMYFTGSRAVASALKKVIPNLMAATSGPNTMVTTELSPNVASIACLSSTIENAGQCTHLRHLVAPKVSTKDIEAMYDNTSVVESPDESIKAGFRCDGIIRSHTNTLDNAAKEGYTRHPRVPAAYVVRKTLPPDNIEEKWREAWVDVTAPEDVTDKKFLTELSEWLVRNGPITLAVNGNQDVAKFLFEQTSMTVYTIGTLDKAAPTVSARPQEMEAFGEFPARPTLNKFTKFPMLVPSSSPSYHTSYTPEFLEKKGKEEVPTTNATVKKIFELAKTATGKGYLKVVHDFLIDATSSGPRANLDIDHARTAVSGWQRTPLNDSPSVVRVNADTSVDGMLVYILPFVATNAAETLFVSIHPSNKEAIEVAKKLGLKTPVEVQDEVKTAKAPYNVQVPVYDGSSVDKAPLAVNLLTLLLPLGHVKCLEHTDPDFVKFWTASPKWLKMA